MAETKTSKVEREYVIPLRDKCRPVPRYKKTPKAVKTVKEFLARHMRIRDRDLKKIRIDTYLNEQLWMRGIKKPLHKVKVKVVKEGDIVRVYSAELPAKINFKKLREEKFEKQAKEEAEKQKTMMQKAKESLQGRKDSEESEEEAQKVEEKKEEAKEKEETSKLAEEKIQKEMAKKEKHTTKVKSGKEKLAEKKGQNMTSRGH